MLLFLTLIIIIIKDSGMKNLHWTLTNNFISISIQCSWKYKMTYIFHYIFCLNTVLSFSTVKKIKMFLTLNFHLLDYFVKYLELNYCWYNFNSLSFHSPFWKQINNHFHNIEIPTILTFSHTIKMNIL